MKKIISILSGLFLFASLNTSAGDFLLNEYNVITIENFTSSGGTHVDGKVFVGGNFTGVENVGSMVKHGNNIDVLTVAGTMQTATYVHNNNIILSAENHALSVVGNDADDNTSINGITVNTKGNVEQSTDLASIKADYKAQLENSSAYFASLKANSSLITKNNKEVLTVSNTLGANDIAVFSLDDATNIFNSSGNNISLSNSNKKNDLNGLEDLAAIIINVSGEKLSIAQNSNMNDIINNANIRAKVIWNFYEATSIDLNSQKFAGTLLAPYATVTQTGGNIDGSVGVLSLITSAEVHLSTDVDVNIPTNIIKPPGSATEVPEPTTLMLMFIAMAGLIYKRKTLNV